MAQQDDLATRAWGILARANILASIVHRPREMSASEHRKQLEQLPEIDLGVAFREVGIIPPHLVALKQYSAPTVNDETLAREILNQADRLHLLAVEQMAIMSRVRSFKIFLTSAMMQIVELEVVVDKYVSIMHAGDGVSGATRREAAVSMRVADEHRVGLIELTRDFGFSLARKTAMFFYQLRERPTRAALRSAVSSTIAQHPAFPLKLRSAIREIRPEIIQVGLSRVDYAGIMLRLESEIVRLFPTAFDDAEFARRAIRLGSQIAPGGSQLILCPAWIDEILSTGSLNLLTSAPPRQGSYKQNFVSPTDIVSRLKSKTPSSSEEKIDNGPVDLDKVSDYVSRLEATIFAHEFQHYAVLYAVREPLA